MDMSELELALAKRREFLDDLASPGGIAGDERIERLRSLVNDTLGARGDVILARAEDEEAAGASLLGPMADLVEAALVPLPAIPETRPKGITARKKKRKG